MIKVLIVNDSRVVQEGMKRLIMSDPECDMIGIANDGFEAIELVGSRNPDVILMDIKMPKCDGVKATEKIMKARPTPVVIVTATLRTHMAHIYDCMSYGALEIIKTPTNTEEGKNLLARIKIANSLKFKMSKSQENKPASVKERPAKSVPSAYGSIARRVIAIGASTGGPSAISTILKELPSNLNAGIIIVQHIDSEFAVGMAEWLDTYCDVKIKPAQDNERIMNGTGLLVSRNENLIVQRGYSVKYDSPKEQALYTPSIDATFKSIAEIYGQQAIGVLLTGMGSDGAIGLKAIRDAGGRTIAQDEATSLIYGMPKAAAQLQAAEFILPPKKMAEQIIKLLQ